MVTINFNKANSVVSKLTSTVNIRDGKEVERVKDYKQKAMPNASQTVMPHWSMKRTTGKWLINMEGDELSRLVRECGLYDRDDNLIVEARVNNIKDAFFNHAALKVTLENGTAEIDDESPIGRAILAWMSATMAYSRKGQPQNTANKMMQRYELTDLKTDLKEKEIAQNELSLSLGHWYKMDFETKLAISMALDVTVTGKIKEQNLDGLMIERLTNRRAERTSDGLRFIDKYNKLREETPATIKLRKTISRSIRGGIIQVSAGQHRFGGHNLGLNQDSVVLFLSAEENHIIYNQFLDAVEEYDTGLRQASTRDSKETVAAMKASASIPMGGVLSLGADGKDDSIDGKDFITPTTAQNGNPQEGQPSKVSGGAPGSQAIDPALEEAEKLRNELASKAKKVVKPEAKDGDVDASGTKK